MKRSLCCDLRHICCPFPRLRQRHWAQSKPVLAPSLWLHVHHGRPGEGLGKNNTLASVACSSEGAARSGLDRDGSGQCCDRIVHFGCSARYSWASAALEAQARKAAVPVTVAAEAVGRYSEIIEAAPWFLHPGGAADGAKYAGPP